MSYCPHLSSWKLRKKIEKYAKNHDGFTKISGNFCTTGRSLLKMQKEAARLKNKINAFIDILQAYFVNLY